MKIDGKIGIGQTIMLIMLTIGITNHVTVIPLLLSKGGRDAWLSVIFAAIPLAGWICMLYFIDKQLYQESLLIWLKRSTHKFVSSLLLGILLLCLFMMALVHLIDTQTWATVNYLPNTPEWFTALVLVAFCVIAAKGGIVPLGITSGIVLPFVVMLGFFVAIGNIPKKDYSLLLPIMQNGFKPVWGGMLYAAGAITELTVLLLLQHHIRKPLLLKHYLIFLVIVVILTLSPLTGAIAEFGPIESARQRFPAFEQWRLLSIGRDIENMEFFAIYQWLSGSFIRISLCILLMTELMGMRTLKQRTFMAMFLGLSLIAFTSLPYSDMQFVSFLSKVYYPLYLILMLFTTLSIAGIALANRNRKRDTGHES
jgi:spore germination protein KB